MGTKVVDKAFKEPHHEISNGIKGFMTAPFNVLTFSRFNYAWTHYSGEASESGKTALLHNPGLLTSDVYYYIITAS